MDRCNVNKYLVLAIVILSIVILILLGVILTGIKHDSSSMQLLTKNLKNYSPEQEHWFEVGLVDLKTAIRLERNQNVAKNVIIFVGDGMGPATVTGSRIYRYGESGRLSWEEFANVATLKTYCNDKQVPDSGSTASALFSGVKINYETIGVDGNVTLSDCVRSLDPKHRLETIMTWAQNIGMKTGFVTTTRVTHATPAALYAHVANRRWECEAKMVETDIELGCMDIAQQLVRLTPGKNLNVIMGGGRQCLVSNVSDTLADPIDKWGCHSRDGRDLIKEWEQDKIRRNLNYATVHNTEDLLQLKDPNYVLGIFANGHLAYDDLRDKTSTGMPSLEQMTSSAIKILSRNNQKGFVLVVESGLIDQAHHRGWAKRAFNEVLAMDEGVKSTLNLMRSKLDETLIIVTSDHSHTLTINGYPPRGNSIFGIAQNSKFDGNPYTTLSYGTGRFGYQIESDENGTYRRADPTKDIKEIEAFDYVQQVAIKTDENTHGGLDVTIHATGPMSHLFHNVHEQSYVAHVISYAARFGRFRKEHKPKY